MRRAAAVLVLLLLLSRAPAIRAAPKTLSFRAGIEAVGHRLADLDGDGALDLVLAGRNGEVRVWRGGETLRPAGSLALPSPARSLLGLGDVLGEGRPQLAVLSPTGLALHRFGPKGFAEEGVPVRTPSRRERISFAIRVGHPRFAEILGDLNGDGRPDLTVPGATTTEIWLCEGAGDGEKEPGTAAPTYRRTATVATETSESRQIEGSALSDELGSSFRIPYLTLQDVNGDGRPDLVAVDDRRRTFHLQREDGMIPEAPDVTLDLELFRDTTPPAGLRPGRTLAGGDDASLSMQDLDGDGIPDYVITHRRKLWVFHGSREGPDFTRPTAILKVAEDVSALLVMPLDDDAYPDLLLLRVQVPSVASLVTGLFSQLSVEIDAAGYRNLGGREFTKTPKWRGELRVRLPELMGVLRNPEGLISRLESAAGKFRRTVNGDFDGDGRPDLALLTEDGKRIEIWRGRDRAAGSFDPGLPDLFFGKEQRSLSLEEVLRLLGQAAEARTLALTGGRDPDEKLPLRKDGATLVAPLAGDVTGDGKDDLILLYRDDATGETLIDTRVS